MYYPNYYNYGYSRRPMYSMYKHQNSYAQNIVNNVENSESKSSFSTDNSTIKFNDYCDNKKEKQNNLNMLGFSIEIDDLIILALIFLLFQDSKNNLSLIIILGLMLFNVNLGDILNFF